MSVYVDTSAFLAVLNVDDDFHSRATPIWFELLNNKDRLITNSFVLLETYALIQNRIGLDAVRTLAQDIVPLLEVRWIDEELYQRTITPFLSTNRRQLSLVDCSSFVTMHQFKIAKVFTFDEHFSEQGFEVLGLKCH